LEWSSYGNGIVLAGARDSLVYNNLLVNNPNAGVQVTSMLDKNLWPSGGNVIRDNVIRGSGRADLMLGGPVEQGSCFSDNDYSTSLPWNIEFFHSCDGIKLPLLAGMAVSHDPLGRIAQAQHGQSPQLGHGDFAKPEGTCGHVPAGAEAPVPPEHDVFARRQIGGNDIPEQHADDDVVDGGRVLLGAAVDGGFWPVCFGTIMWWIKVAVYVLVGA